jgi:3-isopropylmalate/(R)-2-methylmalate dehydratase small subunit
MKAFRSVTSPAVVLDRSDVDTDQIIPKQFLKRIERTGFGEFLFFDWRKDPTFELNHQSGKILIAGRNFGCGSSREHAPWALTDAGFRAVVSSSIADIFRANAVKNGLVPVVVDAKTHEKLLAAADAQVVIDLESLTLRTEDGHTASFPLDPFARHCLMNGTDELGFLLQQADAIAAFEEAHCAR